ncbi:MAG: polysaccharide biosynthesis C-terminal domain-containing protein, partial [Lachnospiraceae bacterium]|nr:polysaccharide biosynthesis C-terminal domain-containing protein [Lachnospiraceae bacterium]
MNKPDILTGSPGKALLFFAFPMILGNLFQQLYNMADSIIVGSFVGEDALAAVGASYSFTTVFIMIALGGGIGASVLTSQFFGAAQYRKMRTSIYTALFTFLAISILLACLGLFVNRSVLEALHTPQGIMTDALTYLNIYFLGLPFLFMYNILSAIFNSLGKSHIPLGLLIFSSLLNVGLDLLFVAVFSMGVGGAALATVIAQGVSVAASFLVLLATIKQYREASEYPTVSEISVDGVAQIEHLDGRMVSERVAIFDKMMLIRGTKIAIPSILQQSIVSIGMLLVQSVVNGFGSSALAGYTAGS